MDELSLIIYRKAHFPENRMDDNRFLADIIVLNSRIQECNRLIISLNSVMKSLALRITQLLLILGVFLFMMACSSKTRVAQISPIEKGPDMVEIFMAKSITMKQIEQEFSSYELKSKGLASRSQNIAIFNFNTAKISGTELLSILIDSEMILAAKLVDGTMSGIQSGESEKKKTVILKQ